jgi:ribosomal protein L37E
MKCIDCDEEMGHEGNHGRCRDCDIDYIVEVGRCKACGYWRTNGLLWEPKIHDLASNCPWMAQ